MLLFKNTFIKRTEKNTWSGAERVENELCEWEWRLWMEGDMGDVWEIWVGRKIWIEWGYGIPFEMGVGTKGEN